MEDYTILPHLTLKFKATVFFLFTTLCIYVHTYIHTHTCNTYRCTHMYIQLNICNSSSGLDSPENNLLIYILI